MRILDRVAFTLILLATVRFAEAKSLQELIDSRPGESIEIPDGTHVIDKALRITAGNTTLHGFAQIVQSNPDENILEIVNAESVRIANLTFTRAEGSQEATRHGILAQNCSGLELNSVRVVDNRSTAGTIQLERCTRSRVHDCRVVNYKRIGVDDRTASDLYGYAFKVIDGTGIVATQCTGVSIQNNQVVEQNLYPTKETKETFELGRLTEGRLPTKKGKLAPQGDYANNWHQGSAIVVTSPEETNHVLVCGNYIENAAQGIDIHADHVICDRNAINHAFIGIKCMHGSRNVIITNNNISHMDLWGLIMMPGTLSHPAEAATEGRPARGPNFTRGNVIANNVFSDFGFGYERFNWEHQKSGVISLESGQLPENPVMTDVLVLGNIVYDSGRDQILVDGEPATIPPRYEFAVYMTPEPRPQGITFANNLFMPGLGGISNIPLEP